MARLNARNATNAPSLVLARMNEELLTEVNALDKENHERSKDLAIAGTEIGKLQAEKAAAAARQEREAKFRPLSEKEERRMRLAFDHFDEDASGELDRAEFRRAMMDCGMMPLGFEVESLFREAHPRRRAVTHPVRAPRGEGGDGVPGGRRLCRRRKGGEQELLAQDAREGHIRRRHDRAVSKCEIAPGLAQTKTKVLHFAAAARPSRRKSRTTHPRARGRTRRRGQAPPRQRPRAAAA